MKYKLAEMVRPITKIKWILASASLLLSAEHAFAAGTSAGTPINNQASVTYTTGGSQVTTPSNTATITVQELINVSLVYQGSGDVIVNSPQAQAPVKFTMTNTGNGSESFSISQSNLSGDDFEATIGSVYVDDGDGVFEPGTDDVLYAEGALAADASITLWAVSAIPDSLGDNSTADVQIKALSTTFSNAGNGNPQPGDVVNSQGSSGTDAVAGTSGAQNSQTITFRVSAIAVAIVKSVTGARDNLGQGGSQYVPGAEVDYRLAVSVTGTGTAADVSVTDQLPTELRLLNGTDGTITVNGVVMSAKAKAIDGDDATYDANTNTITVDLGDMASGSSINVDFTTVIQ